MVYAGQSCSGPRDGLRIGQLVVPVALHGRLFAHTIYRRYFGVRPHLSLADVDHVIRVDGRTRLVPVAFAAPTSSPWLG